MSKDGAVWVLLVVMTWSITGNVVSYFDKQEAKAKQQHAEAFADEVRASLAVTNPGCSCALVQCMRQAPPPVSGTLKLRVDSTVPTLPPTAPVASKSATEDFAEAEY